jgi:hypothetical protein
MLAVFAIKLQTKGCLIKLSDARDVAGSESEVM